MKLFLAENYGDKAKSELTKIVLVREMNHARLPDMHKPPFRGHCTCALSLEALAGSSRIVWSQHISMGRRTV